MELRGLGSLLDLIHLILHPRELVRVLRSVVLQLGFAIIAIPVGCFVSAVVFALGFATLLGLSVLLTNDDVFVKLVIPWLVVSMAAAFVVLVLLYRKMPRGVRAGIEGVEAADEPTPSASPQSSSTGAMTDADLMAIDAKLAPTADDARTGRNERPET